MCVRIIMFHRPFSPLPSFFRHDGTYTQSGLLVWLDKDVSTCAPRMGQQAHSPGQSEAAPRE